MKKILVITGLVFCLLSYNNTAKSANYCLGIFVTIMVDVCYEYLLEDGNVTEKCVKVAFSFCRGFSFSTGRVGILLPNENESTIFITNDIIIPNFEYEEGSFSDIIIPSGEAAEFDDVSGHYLTNYYLYN